MDPNSYRTVSSFVPRASHKQKRILTADELAERLHKPSSQLVYHFRPPPQEINGPNYVARAYPTPPVVISYETLAQQPEFQESSSFDLASEEQDYSHDQAQVIPVRLEDQTSSEPKPGQPGQKHGPTPKRHVHRRAISSSSPNYVRLHAVKPQETYYDESQSYDYLEERPKRRGFLSKPVAGDGDHKFFVLGYALFMIPLLIFLGILFTKVDHPSQPEYSIKAKVIDDSQAAPTYNGGQ